MILRETVLKEQQDYVKKEDNSCLAEISLLQQEKQSLTLINQDLSRSLKNVQQTEENQQRSVCNFLIILL